MARSQQEEATSSEEIAELKRLREQGEVDEQEYDVIRRHVLWGTPLPADVVLPATLQKDEPASADEAAPDPPTDPAPPASPTPPGSPTPPADPARPTDPVPPLPSNSAAKRRLPLVFAAVVLVVVAAGGATWWSRLRTDPAASARDYAGGVCSDISGWRSAIVGAAKQLTDDVTEAAPPGAQQAAADYFASAARRTDQLAKQLAEHDADGFDGGTAYAARLAAVADQAGDWFRARAQRVRDLDVNSGPIFASVFDQITATPDDPVDTVVAVVGESAAPEDLARAYDDVASCRQTVAD